MRRGGGGRGLTIKWFEHKVTKETKWARDELAFFIFGVMVRILGKAWSMERGAWSMESAKRPKAGRRVELPPRSPRAPRALDRTAGKVVRDS